ncbi:hypothetical protein GYMLUDRAFT_243943 [Collybiopsis luxurians FD-317 M1]|uniref:Uncharacterized protein n=1 Tax=Collybiopsis luxurians FD-317 M1 TaxID=944289 RepID=A0A0D0BAN2_9AGAR|nr:hypothetical protein GYMLUDRAFT_243943 [Collybiopsis luxurians FD-317 M1]
MHSKSSIIHLVIVFVLFIAGSWASPVNRESHDMHVPLLTRDIHARAGPKGVEIVFPSAPYTPTLMGDKKINWIEQLVSKFGHQQLAAAASLDTNIHFHGKLQVKDSKVAFTAKFDMGGHTWGVPGEVTETGEGQMHASIPFKMTGLGKRKGRLTGLIGTLCRLAYE